MPFSSVHLIDVVYNKVTNMLVVAAEVAMYCNMFTSVMDYTVKGFLVQSVSPAQRNGGCCSMI